MKKIILFSAICTASLVASQLDLGQIEVYSATKSNQSIKDITSNVEVITNAELEERKITTVLDALAYKGIIGTQSGGLGQPSSFFLRGFKSSDTLVLIDGVTYNDPTSTEGEAFLEHLMISDIERIEIIKGAQSGIWGSNAVAGVVNIITKKSSQNLNVNANIEIGSNSTKKYSMSVSQKLERLSYYLGASKIKSDGISAVTPPNEDPKDFERDGYENRTINAKLGFDITNTTKLDLGVTDINAKTQYDESPSFVPILDATQYEYDQKHDNRIYNIKLTQKFNDNDYVALDYQKSTFDRQMNGFSTIEYKSSIKKYAIQSKIHYLENSFVLFGAQKSKTIDKENDYEINNKAYYITNSNSFDNFTITQSLRHDKFKEVEDKTTGKIGVKYNFDNDINVSANYGTAYKAPVVDQLFGKYWAWWINDWVTYGNEDLKPESTKGYDVSIQYKDLTFTYFNNKVKDLIDYSFVTSSYDQIEGKSTIKGYELRYEKEVLENLLFGAYYNRTFAKDSDGKYLERRARSTAGASIDYYGLSNTHFGIYANYVGTRYDDIAQENQTGRYTLIDAVVNYTINNNFSTYCKVENLMDKEYQAVHNYGANGRTIKIGLNAKF